MANHAPLPITGARRPFARWDRNPRVVRGLKSPASKNAGQIQANAAGTLDVSLLYASSTGQRECRPIGSVLAFAACQRLCRAGHTDTAFRRHRTCDACILKPYGRYSLSRAACSSLGLACRLQHASRRPPVKLSMVSDIVLSMASLGLVSLAELDDLFPPSTITRSIVQVHSADSVPPRAGITFRHGLKPMWHAT